MDISCFVNFPVCLSQVVCVCTTYVSSFLSMFNDFLFLLCVDVYGAHSVVRVCVCVFVCTCIPVAWTWIYESQFSSIDFILCSYKQTCVCILCVCFLYVYSM